MVVDRSSDVYAESCPGRLPEASEDVNGRQYLEIQFTDRVRTRRDILLKTVQTTYPKFSV